MICAPWHDKVDSHFVASEIAPSAETATLSEKETRALELVAAQFTTKEIARELGITPRGVEERLKSARDKLDAPDRRAAARVLLQRQQACGETTGEPTTLEFTPPATARRLRDLPDASVFTLNDSVSRDFEREVDAPGFLEAFDVRFGKPGRVAAIVFVAVALGILGAAAVSIAVTLGQMLN